MTPVEATMISSWLHVQLLRDQSTSPGLFFPIGVAGVSVAGIADDRLGSPFQQAPRSRKMGAPCTRFCV